MGTAIENTAWKTVMKTTHGQFTPKACPNWVSGPAAEVTRGSKNVFVPGPSSRIP
jgi:hypothetical protein